MLYYDDIIDLERPSSKHHPMPVSHRAKQFIPFAALKGFEDSIRKKEDLYATCAERSSQIKYF